MVVIYHLLLLPCSFNLFLFLARPLCHTLLLLLLLVLSGSGGRRWGVRGACSRGGGEGEGGRGRWREVVEEELLCSCFCMVMGGVPFNVGDVKRGRM